MERYDNKIATVSRFNNLEPWSEVFNTTVALHVAFAEKNLKSKKYLDAVYTS